MSTGLAGAALVVDEDLAVFVGLDETVEERSVGHEADLHEGASELETRIATTKPPWARLRSPSVSLYVVDDFGSPSGG